VAVGQSALLAHPDSRFVSAKLTEAGVVLPVGEAVTLYGPPSVLLAVTFALAIPETSVVAVEPTGNVTLAPDPGAVNVTTFPEIGLSLASVTRTDKGVANAVLMTAD